MDGFFLGLLEASFIFPLRGRKGEVIPQTDDCEQTIGRVVNFTNRPQILGNGIKSRHDAVTARSTTCPPKKLKPLPAAEPTLVVIRADDAGRPLGG